MRYTTTKHTTGLQATVYTFASLTDALDEAREGMATGCPSRPNRDSAKSLAKRLANSVDDAQWADGMTWDAAMASVSAPPEWKREALSRFDCGAYSAPLAPAPRRRLVKRLDDGDAIDAVRYATEFTVEGVWSKRVRSTMHRPVVRILLNSGALAEVTADMMARNAAASLAFIRIAEDSGYAVEADWGSHFTVGFGRHYAIRTRVKEVHEAIDWTTLAALCIGGGVHRSIGWMLRNACLDVSHDGSYGSSKQDWHDSGEYDAVSKGWMHTDEEAQKWLADACNRLTGLASAAA